MTAAERPARRREETAALLRERLGPSSPALGFALAVVDQVGRSAGPEAERAAAEWTVRLMAAAREGRGDAADLAGRHALLAAVFQNVDLLYAAGDPAADAVSALVMAALERLDAGGAA